MLKFERSRIWIDNLSAWRKGVFVFLLGTTLLRFQNSVSQQEQRVFHIGFRNVQALHDFSSPSPAKSAELKAYVSVPAFWFGPWSLPARFWTFEVETVWTSSLKVTPFFSALLSTFFASCLFWLVFSKDSLPASTYHQSLISNFSTSLIWEAARVI